METELKGEKLAVAIRKKRGEMTLRDAAVQIGIDYTTLWMYENGRRTPQGVNIQRLSKWLGIPVDRILKMSLS